MTLCIGAKGYGKFKRTTVCNTYLIILLQTTQLNNHIFPWPVSRECIPQEPGRIEYYDQLLCLRDHLRGVNEFQTSLDVSDL